MLSLCSFKALSFFRSQPQTCFTYLCHHPLLLCCSIGATTKYLVFLSSYSPGLKTFMWEGENIPNQYRAWIGLGLLWQGSAGNRKKVVEFKETQSLCHLFMLQHQSYDLPAHYASQRSMKAVKGCRAYYKHAWSPVHCIGKEIKPMPLLFLEVTVKMLFIPVDSGPPSWRSLLVFETVVLRKKSTVVIGSVQNESYNVKIWWF